MSEMIDCWKHGVKVIAATKCNHFSEGKTCGDHPNCFFKSSVAKWQYFEAKKHGAGEVDDERAEDGNGSPDGQNEDAELDEEEIEEKQVVNVDDAFW